MRHAPLTLHVAAPQTKRADSLDARAFARLGRVCVLYALLDVMTARGEMDQ